MSVVGSVSAGTEKAARATVTPGEIQATRAGIRSVPWDMLAVLAVTGAVIVLFKTDATGGVGLARMLLAVSLLLFLPGYALTVVLFAGAGQLGWMERLGLSVTFSVATVVIDCLALYFMGVPLNGQTILVGIVCLNMLLVIASLVRRYMLAPAERYEPLAGLQMSALGSTFDRLTAAGIALVVALGLGGLWYALVADANQEWLTEFAVVPSDTGNGSTLTSNGQGNYDLTLSVTNREHDAHVYNLRVIAGGRQLGASDTGILQPGESWQGEVHVAAGELANSGLLKLELWLPGTEAPYRELQLRTGTDGSTGGDEK